MADNVDTAVRIESIRASTNRCYANLSAPPAAAATKHLSKKDVVRIRWSLAYVLSREPEWWWSNPIIAKARVEDEPRCTRRQAVQKLETAVTNLTSCVEALLVVGSSIDDHRNWWYTIQRFFTGKQNLRTELLKAEVILNQTLLDLNHDNNTTTTVVSTQYNDATLLEQFVSLQGTDDEKLSYLITTLDTNIPSANYQKTNEIRQDGIMDVEFDEYNPIVPIHSADNNNNNKITAHHQPDDDIINAVHQQPVTIRIHSVQPNWKLVLLFCSSRVRTVFVFGIVVVVVVLLLFVRSFPPLSPEEPTTQESVPCFITSSELRTSVFHYITGDTVVRTKYGTNIGDWCVDSIEDFSFLFGNPTDRYTVDNIFHEDISKWNTSSAKNMSHMFHNANTFHGNLSSWDVSNVIDMSYMFAYANTFNGNLSSWDVSNVIDMSSMFAYAGAFNGDVSSWDVSNVTDMSDMFSRAGSFNGNLSAWDVSNVISTNGMFFFAVRFNSNLSSWDVSNVSNMSRMFASAVAFNGDLSSWDVSNVTVLSRTFASTSAFDGNISFWDVSKVTDMSGMFEDAYSFNGDLSFWDVSNVRDLSRMFARTDTFHQNLCPWGNRFNYNTKVRWMFVGTLNCPSNSNPSLNNTPPGPFCYVC